MIAGVVFLMRYNPADALSFVNSAEPKQHFRLLQLTIFGQNREPKIPIETGETISGRYWEAIDGRGVYKVSLGFLTSGRSASR